MMIRVEPPRLAEPEPVCLSRVEKVTVALVLLVHGLLLVISAWLHSPVVDEVGHLPAGFFHWKFARYDLFAVNPPLVRMVAALPLHLFTLRESWGFLNDMAGSRSEWPIGVAFCELNGPKVFALFSWARCCCIPFSLLGGFFCFRWARQLYGPSAGAVAILLWCASPMALGFGALCVPDLPAAAMGITLFWFFRSWLRHGGWSLAFQTGCLLGLTLLTKLTWVLLWGMLPALWLVYGWLIGRRRAPFKQLVFAFSVGWTVLNLGYEFSGTFTPLGRFEFVSETLAGGTNTGNRFRDSVLEAFPVPLPSPYVTGVDVQKFDFETGFRSYLRAHWKQGGWWYYYLYGCLMKVPIGGTIIAILACWIAIRDCDESTLPDDILLLVPAAVIFTLVSTQTGFNHHLRYVFPAAPFLIVQISRVGRWLDDIRPALRNGPLSFATGPARMAALRAMAVAGCLVWYVASSLLQYPHSLSYFNALAGGPSRGHEHLIDSNIDWGQDLLFLKRYLDRHPEVNSLGLAYYGLVDPRSAGISYRLPPSGLPPAPGTEIGHPASVAGGPREGYFALSINYLYGKRFTMANGEGGVWASNADHFTYFRQLRPIGRAGYSIYIYRVSKRDAQRLRSQLGWGPVQQSSTARQSRSVGLVTREGPFPTRGL